MALCMENPSFRNRMPLQGPAATTNPKPLCRDHEGATEARNQDARGDFV